MNSSRKYLILTLIIVGILVVAGVVYATVFAPSAPEDTAAPVAVTEETAAPAEGAPAADWVKAALVDRSLGDDNAPIVIYDFSSLTCPHCAHFHTETLPQVKKEYIDTGKARLVFADFPLNLPALQASALARCIEDNDAYFAFIDQLFRTQAQWGTTENARADLINAIKFSGLSRDDAARCIDDQTLTSGLVEKIDNARGEYSVQSTPTFVIVKDGKVVDKIEGAQPFENFKTALDKAL